MAPSVNFPFSPRRGACSGPAPAVGVFLCSSAGSWLQQCSLALGSSKGDPRAGRVREGVVGAASAPWATPAAKPEGRGLGWLSGDLGFGGGKAASSRAHGGPGL